MNPEDGSRRCYLCGGSRFGLRPGKVRDSGTLRVLECASGAADAYAANLTLASRYDTLAGGFSYA